MEKKFVCFLSKLFRRGCGNHIVFSEHFFWKLQWFFYNFEKLIDFLPAFWHFFRRGCQKCILRVIGKHLMRKKTRKFWIFSLLWVFERKFFAFFPNSLCLICQSCIPRVHRKLEWKLFLHKVSIFCYIGTLSEYFCPLVGNLPAVFSKLPSLCLKQRFEKNCFFLKEILLFSSFLVIDQKMFDNLAFFGKVVKTLYWLPVGKIWGDFFPENTSFPIVFGNWVKLYWLLLISLAWFSAGSSKFHTTC